MLTQRAEGSRLVMAGQLWNDLKDPKQIDDPKVNIRAGIAYLFTRMAKFEEQSVNDSSDTKVYTHTVFGGESFATIAPKRGTTVASLKEHNPKGNVIQPNQVVKYRKARLDLVVVGWRTFKTVTVAQRYNVGDPDYASKLDFCMAVFKKLKR